MKLSGLCKIFSVLVFQFSSIVAQDLIKRLDNGNDWEKWVDEVPVSGELRVGLVLEYSGNNIEKGVFYAKVPQTDKKKLCAIISSKDGRYRANALYDLTNSTPNKYNAFEWDTNHHKQLKAYKTKDLVILCKIAESCEDKPEGYTIASWHNINTAVDTMTAYMLLNSEVKPKLKFDKKSNEDCECSEIEDVAAVSYNYVCRFPKALLLNSRKLEIVQKTYMMDEITYEKIPFPLMIAN